MAVSHPTGGGDATAATSDETFNVATMSREDIAHLRDLMFASLAEEAGYLVQHAAQARAGDVGCGEDAEAASYNVRRTCALLDTIGWGGL